MVEAIGFNMGDMIDTVENSPEIDVAYTVAFNEWNGKKTIQLNLKAIRPVD
jgi:single-stranded-DNA-specific exonuclease